MSARHILALSCPDRPGIVAAVTGLLAERGDNITDAQQYGDPVTERFFLRVVFDSPDPAGFEAGFAALAERFGMEWTLRAQAQRPRVLILVSKFDHCLVDLIYRTRLGEIPMEIAGVVSNHPRAAIGVSNLHGAEFTHIPVTRATKPEAEARLREVIADSRADYVVLARYMQILSDGLSRELMGRCVNIHHSFLPGFKGARPYHQAHRRGVKMIGATAHFVTPDLDEGPIIAQGVEPISHRDTPETMVAHGRSIEQRVLARAVKALVEDRVFLNGERTVVFS